MNNIFITDTIAVADTQMRYLRFGSGKRTMVIIPGLNAIPVTNDPGLAMFGYEQFTKDYTIYLFDVIDDVPEGYSLVQMSEDLVCVLRKMQLTDIYLFGTSMGGMQAIYIAGTYQELVKKLVIGSSECKAAQLLNDVINKWIGYAQNGDAIALAESETDYCYSQKTKKEFWLELTAFGKDLTPNHLQRFIRIAKCILGFDFSRQAASIQCPALLMGSEGDRMMSRETMEETARIIGCDFYFYDKEYGHVVYAENLDFKKRILEFYAL